MKSTASPRRTRQRTKALAEVGSGAQEALAKVNNNVTRENDSVWSDSYIGPALKDPAGLPERLTASLTRLSNVDHELLLQKQEHLRMYEVVVPRDFKAHQTVVDASLVFAQEEAGTAVCVGSEGFLLTCSHCVAETEDDLDYEKVHWLLFADGRVVSAKCVAWDAHRDLALLRVIAAQPSVSEGKQEPAFPSVRLADRPPAVGSRLVCVGHPGSEDLEASQPGVKTNYDVLHLSTGTFRGYAEDQDVQDNSEIGALMHDCWTYWGHSGAPILDRGSGRLIGLHSSWDDETAMRRGVPLEAIRSFLESSCKGLL